MDTNLTRTHGIAQLAEGLHPVPGYDLVIFKKTGQGEGREFRQVVSPGEKFQRRFFERQEDFVAFKVSRDRQKRYRFNKLCLMRDNVRSFTLHVTMAYGVADPRLVAEGLEGDPLKKVEDEISDVLCGLASGLDWSVIQEGGKELAAILGHEVADAHGVVGSALERLQDFARQVGIEILDLSVDRTLPESSVKVGKTRIEVENKEQVRDLEQRLELQEEIHQSERRSLQRAREGLDTVASNLATMLTKASSQVDSFSRMKQAMNDLQVLSEQLERLTASAPAADGGATRYLGAGETMPLLMAGAADLGGSFGKLGALLAQTLELLAQLDLEDRRPFVSAVLHLLGEVVRDGDADEELISRHADEIRRLFRAQVQSMSRDQVAVMRRLLDPSNLRQELRNL